MSENWYRLDNVAKVFLAAHTNRDPRAMRVSMTLDDDIIPEKLQEALDEAIILHPEFQVRIRRGLFWHYMEQTNYKPEVAEEDDRPCPILYGNNYRGRLHYKVSYYGKRINLDIFHAISDGMGALTFLKQLTICYLKLVHPEDEGLKNAYLGNGASTDDRLRNSYAQFYENKESKFIPKKILNKKKNAYHIQSRKLPLDQLQFIEVHLDAKSILGRAKEMGVSMTSYLGAELMMAIHLDRPVMLRGLPITVSLPVNLRNYFPSETMRNFFNNVDVTHIFTGDETVETLAGEFDRQMKESLEPDRIREQMNRYEGIERLLVTRISPLIIKQLVVKGFSKQESRRVTAVLSNLGKQILPPEMKKYVTGFSDYCSTEKLFITTTTYDNDFVLGISSAYTGTGVIRRFINALHVEGCDVTVHASEVFH